ncbi:MAG: hypothetical protein PHY16_06760 [Methylobacter sp.]|nr:hypothetical protein [Methylobacter sp.]
MKIHNSSLTFLPIGFNRQQVDKNSTTPNSNADKDLAVVKEALNKKSNKPVLAASSSAEARQTLNNANNDGLSFNEVNRENIIHTRTLRALTAYHQELNTPLQDQDTNLIEGIDIYA